MQRCRNAGEPVIEMNAQHGAITRPIRKCVDQAGWFGLLQ